jgi:serine/threonine-protein kinase
MHWLRVAGTQGHRSFVGERVVNLRRLLAALGIWALALGAGAAVAEDDEGDAEQAHYGAIAYSPSTRAHGWSYNYTSRREAEQRALARCRRYADDCVLPVWFRNACGALAVGADGYGSGWGSSRKLAEGYAVQSCSRYSGGCTVVRWVCTIK